jgi:hypothetical protein
MEGYVLGKLQRWLDSIATWCKRWNIKLMKKRFGQSIPEVAHRNGYYQGLQNIYYIFFLFQK